MKRKDTGKKLRITILAFMLAVSSAPAAAFAAGTENAATSDTVTAIPAAAPAPKTSGQLEITLKTYRRQFQTNSGLVYKKISYQYPVAADSSDAAAAFNKFYKNQRIKWLKITKTNLNDAKELIRQLAADSGGSTDQCYTDDVTCKIMNADENYICIFQQGYHNTLGVHGTPYRITYIFDAKTGKKVTAATLLGMTKQQLNTKVRKLFLNKFDKKKIPAVSRFMKTVMT